MLGLKQANIGIEAGSYWGTIHSLLKYGGEHLSAAKTDFLTQTAPNTGDSNWAFDLEII